MNAVLILLLIKFKVSILLLIKFKILLNDFVIYNNLINSNRSFQDCIVVFDRLFE